MTRIGSLFSGYGGLDLGVQSAIGGQVVWHCEYDKAPSAILAHHYSGVVNFGDVKKVDWSTVEPIDVLTGGYPCQPFSHAGNRKGTTDERHLWPYVALAISALRPSLVVLENVAGHLSLGLGDVLGDLAALGYDATWGVVRASDAGACHQRARIFIVADANSSGCSEHRGTVADVAQLSTAQHSRHVAADANSAGGEARGDAGHDGEEFWAQSVGLADHIEWGKYGPAIARWAYAIGRPAPAPTESGSKGRPRLSPAFVEWMMGLPAGHVTDPAIGISRTAQLKALGNGVVPLQAALALSVLLPLVVAE